MGTPEDVAAEKYFTPPEPMGNWHKCRDCHRKWWLAEDTSLNEVVPFPHVWNFGDDSETYSIRELDEEELQSYDLDMKAEREANRMGL